MTEETGAAPSEAAEEDIVAETALGKAPIEADATQAKPEGDAEVEELSESAKRRQRKKEADARIRAELEEARARLARYEERATAQQRPDPSQYSDPDQYLAELAGWSAAQAVARSRVDEVSDHVRQIEQAGLRQRIDAFETAAQELAATYPDFQAARQVAANPSIVSQPLSEMVLESDAAAHLAYHLGKNPTEAIRLSQLGPLAMAREIAALEARFIAPKPKTVTTAPAPLSPVKPAGTAMKNPGDMTPQEWAAARRAGWKP